MKDFSENITDHKSLDEYLNRLIRWREKVAMILVDHNTGKILYERCADELFPLASITKIMSAYCFMNMIGNNDSVLKEFVTIDKETAALSADPNCSAYEHMREGERYSVDFLLRMMLVPSSCASALALAKHFFGTEKVMVCQMNEYAEEIGLSGHFVCPGGIDPRNQCSARDLSVLAGKLISSYPQILAYTSQRSIILKGTEYQTTNHIIRSGQFDGMDGLKTGTSPEAGCCFVGTASCCRHRVISVVLNAQQKKESFESTKILLRYGLDISDENKN